MTATALDRRDLEFQLREVLADSTLVRTRQTGDALEEIYAAAARMASQPLARGFSLVMRQYSDYIEALALARERYQSVSSANPEQEEAFEPLIARADVRCDLLAQKAACEGGLALCLYGADLLSEENEHPDAALRAEAGSLFGLLAPVIAGWPAMAFPDDSEASQRARTAAGELLGRKVWHGQSQGLQILMQRMQIDLQAAGSGPGQQWALSLSETLQQAIRVTQSLGQSLMEGQTSRVLANSQNYLRLFGHVLVAWMWLRQANVAARALPVAVSEADEQFYRGKVQAAQHFFHRELPRVAQDLVLLRNQDDTCLNMQPEWF